MPKTHSLLDQPAPQIELPVIPTGTMYKLPLGEKPIAIFFFPSAFSSGCTREACQFRDAKVKNETFKRHADLEIIGISRDNTDRLQSFADQYGLPYPLLSDADGSARKAYQVNKAFFGTTDGRLTYFIDRQGIVRGVLDKMIDIGDSHTKFIEQHLRQSEKAAPLNIQPNPQP